MNRAAGKEKQKRSTLNRTDELWAYLFVAPQIIGILVFTLIPILFSILLAFCDWNLLKTPEFVGFSNFEKVWGNPNFYLVLKNTGYYVLLYVPAVACLGIVLALLMNKPYRSISVLRTMVYLPNLTSSVAVCLVWSFIFQRNGLLSSALGAFGITAPKWLADPNWAMPSVVMVCVWRAMGYHMVLYLAGLKGINPTYYEAARIDGAGRMRLFVHITLPMLSPTIFFAVCTSVINSFQVFDEVYMLTNGGPGRSTQTMVFQIYTSAFERMTMGRASVWSLSLFLIILLFTGIQFFLQKYWVNYDA